MPIGLDAITPESHPLEEDPGMAWYHNTVNPNPDEARTPGDSDTVTYGNGVFVDHDA
jgi:hypothetical protein